MKMLHHFVWPQNKFKSDPFFSSLDSVKQQLSCVFICSYYHISWSTSTYNLVMNFFLVKNRDMFLGQIVSLELLQGQSCVG